MESEAPKPTRKDLTIRRLKNQTVVKEPSFIAGYDFKISFCYGCDIRIFNWLKCIYIDDCKDCSIILGPLNGPVCIRDCENLTVYCAATQIRINKSKNVTMYTFSESDPTIENCEGLVFAPYTLEYPLLDKHFEESGLTIAFDRWNQVYDMNHDASNPSWKIMDPSIFPGKKTVKWESAKEAPSNPIPIPNAYGGSQDMDIFAKKTSLEEMQGDMVYFDIKTSNQQAKMSMKTENQPTTQESQFVVIPDTENLNELPTKSEPKNQPIANESLSEKPIEKRPLVRSDTVEAQPLLCEPLLASKSSQEDEIAPLLAGYKYEDNDTTPLLADTNENDDTTPLLAEDKKFDNSAAEAFEQLEDYVKLEKLFKGVMMVTVALFFI